LCIIYITAVSKPQPKYDINDFLKACGKDNLQPSLVSLVRGVRKTAAEDFSLKTRLALLAFIAEGGLEKLEFINSRPYRISNEVPPPICDAYRFKSGFTIGYISFFYSEFQKKWIIKSFHRSDECGPSAMEIALKNANLLPENLEGDK
jgi:hypothetical protein